MGYDGGNTIIKDYLRAVRKNPATRRAYVRVEPAPGERFDIDRGHFGALVYNGATRKLYAFCLVESHSRKMISSSLTARASKRSCAATHAFEAMGGIARELWLDNLATAVAEHEGNLVRFNPRFLGFAREYGFVLCACHVAAAWEKGKVERAIGYVRQNHKSRMELKNRILRLLVSSFWLRAPAQSSLAIPAWERPFSLRSSAGEPARPISAVKRRAVAISRAWRSPPGNPSTALLNGSGSRQAPPLWFLPSMFNFSANHLLLLRVFYALTPTAARNLDARLPSSFTGGLRTRVPALSLRRHWTPLSPPVLAPFIPLRASASTKTEHPQTPSFGE